MNEHCIAFAQGDIVHFQSGLDVSWCNHRATVETRRPAGGIGLQLVGFLEHLDHVEDYAACSESLKVFKSQLLDAVLSDKFSHRRLIVIAILDADVAHAVDM